MKRGLVAEREKLVQRLRDVGYYRLSAYTHLFRTRNEDGTLGEEFIPGTSLDLVWEHYLFDRCLRLHFLDSIERIEVSLRVKIAHLHARESGPFGYTERNYFPHWNGYEEKLMGSKVQIKRDKDTGEIVPTGSEYADHFFRKYGDMHNYLPIWMAVGMIDYGMLTYFFRHSSHAIQSEIAKEWAINPKSLRSWLLALRHLRNICAHHGRVWNRSFPGAPDIPSIRIDERWYYAYSLKAHKWVRPTRRMDGMSEWRLNPETTAAFLFVCRHLMRYVAPSSRWKERVELCLHKAQEKGIVLAKMGLPEHW